MPLEYWQVPIVADGFAAVGGDTAKFQFEVGKFAPEAFCSHEACRVITRVIDAFAGRQAFDGGLHLFRVASIIQQQLLADAVNPGRNRVHRICLSPISTQGENETSLFEVAKIPALP